MFDQIDAPSLNVKRSFLCCIHFSKSLLKTMHSNGGTNANVLTYNRVWTALQISIWKRMKILIGETCTHNSTIKKALTTSSQMHQSFQPGYYYAIHKDINQSGSQLLLSGSELSCKWEMFKTALFDDSIFLPSFLMDSDKNMEFFAIMIYWEISCWDPSMWLKAKGGYFPHFNRL